MSRPRDAGRRAIGLSASGLSVLASAALLLMSTVAHSQATRSSAFTVTPSLSVTETLTDHHRNTSSGSDQWESVTTVGGAVRITGRTGRVRADVDYGLTGVVYGRDTGDSSLQNRLSGVVQGDLVPDHLDVTLTGSISRQPRSAFGRQSDEGTRTELNQTEVRSFSLRPRLRGVVAGLVAAQATVVATKSSSGAQLGTEEYGAALNLSSVGSRARFGWAADLTSQRIRYDSGGDIKTDRGILSLLWRPDMDLQFVVRAGEERTDLGSLDQRRYENYGAGVVWTPSPRTLLSLDADRRSFGHSHAFTIEHRLRRSVLRYSDAQSVSTDSSQSGASAVTAYDLFFALFASQEPDPAARDVLVRDFLSRQGLAPDTVLASVGFLTATASLQRRQELSLAISGQRTSFLLGAFASRNERVDTGSTIVDDTLFGVVRQHGLRFTASHRLTPRDSLILRLSTVRSRGEGGDDRIGRLDSISLGWSTRLNSRSSFGLTAQHSESDQATDPYTENAVTAAFSTRF